MLDDLSRISGGNAICRYGMNNYCTGAKDAKASMAEAERQLKRIYR